MPSSVQCAARIKSSYNDVLTNAPTTQDTYYTYSDIFRPIEGGRDVPVERIWEHARDEYDEWLDTKEPLIEVSCDRPEYIHKWIEDISEDDLASVISQTPDRVESSDHGMGFEFTPWQRLSMWLFVHNPFPSMARIDIDTDAVRSISYHQGYVGSRRKIPINAQFSLQKGEPPDVSIIDLPTGAGKTAWGLCVLFMMMCPDMYTRLCKNRKRKRVGEVYEGDILLKVARLSIVAVGSSVYGHFVDTLQGLIPVFKRMLPEGYDINVWTRTGVNRSVEDAYNMPDNVITFWIMKPDEIIVERRKHPSISIMACLVDEMEISPNSRSKTSMSPIMKQLLTQATPQRLVKATRGSNYLREFFEGELFRSADDIAYQMRSRNFAYAHRICEQLCKIKLITQFAFRKAVLSDLAQLLPLSMNIRFIKSRRQTLASHILGATTDNAPISMAAAICKMVETQDFRVHESLRVQIKDLFRGLNHFNIQDVTEKLLAMKDVHGKSIPQGSMTRLTDRYNEFSTDGCPICMTNSAMDTLRFCGSCGYAMCNMCCLRCDKCPFCRKAMRIANPTAETVDLTEEVENDDDYPTTLPIPDGIGLDATLRAIHGLNLTQIKATTMTLLALIRYGYKRPLILVEKNSYHAMRDNPIIPSKLSRACGMEILNADEIRGRGTDFNRMKERFDRRDNIPRAFICFSNPSFMVGTDLCMADCIVTSGTFADKLVTQAIGRAIRPRPDRDPTKPIVLATVHV